MTEYFSDSELRCKASQDYILAPEFGGRLDKLRRNYGAAIYLNSAARSKEYNESIGGHPRSLHVYDEPYHNTGGCCAVDVRMNDPIDRARLIEVALGMGFSVGVDRTFVHIDDRTRTIGLPKSLFVYR